MVSSSIRKAFNYLFRAGLNKSDFNSIIPKIREENRFRLKMSTLSAIGVFLVLFITTSYNESFASVNNLSYLLTALIMVVLYLAAQFATKKFPKLIIPLVYFFMAVLYAFSVWIAALHPGLPAVTSIVFLFAIPMLFCDRPINMVLMTALSAVGMCYSSFVYNDPEIASVDLFNFSSFGVVSILANILLMGVKVKAIFQETRIVYLSRTDILTGLKNRNCYESNLHDYPRLSSNTVSCIYADINGLHELNNTKGHKAGDIMLRFIASRMQEQFGEDHTYRIGGDEFVAFAVDRTTAEISAILNDLKQSFDERGYSVAFGLAETGSENADMEALVKRSEDSMYKAKSRYYGTKEHSRRSTDRIRSNEEADADE